MKYLRDLNFASFNPENRALDLEGNLASYGGTSVENAIAQHSAVHRILASRKTPLLDSLNEKSPLKKLLEENAKELKVVGIDIEKLII